MKEEASEQNGNEKHIYHRILSWCGEHKMKLTLIVVVAILLGGVLYQENKDTFKITVELEPERVKEGERITLTVTIIPLEHLEGDFEIEVKPEDTAFIHIHEKNASYNPENDSWIFSLGKLDLKVGMDWKYVYYLSGNTDRTASTWKIDVFVRYKPEINPDDREEHDETRYIAVEKADVPIPSFWDKVKESLKRNIGFCLGTKMILVLVIMGSLVISKKKKNGR